MTLRQNICLLGQSESVIHGGVRGYSPVYKDLDYGFFEPRTLDWVAGRYGKFYDSLAYYGSFPNIADIPHKYTIDIYNLLMLPEDVNYSRRGVWRYVNLQICSSIVDS